jgi:hypothetical protein
MAKRGRASSESSRVRVIDGGLNKRPDAPEELTERQAEIWRETVSSEPADWFGTAALRSMLSDYCCHREAVENVTQVLNQFKPDWLKNAEGAKRYKELLKMREAETRAAASLAGKLRLTNQSRYTPQAAGTAARNAAKGLKPWEM